MRNFSVTMLAAGVLAATAAVRAQTYSPDYPVCLHVYGPATHIECAFTSLAQCNATASGRAAECEVNPFLASAEPIGAVHHSAAITGARTGWNERPESRCREHDPRRPCTLHVVRTWP